MNTTRMNRVARSTRDRMRAHNVTVAAAGVAFFVLVASVPAVVSVVSIYGLVSDPSDIEAQIDGLGSAVPAEVKDLLSAQLGDVAASSSSELTVGLVVGLLLALVTSSGAMRSLINTLNVAEGVTESRPFLRLRAIALVFTFGAVVLAAGSIYAIAILPAVVAGTELGDTGRWLIGFARFPLLALAFGSGLVVLYRHGPDRPPGRSYERFVPGAAVATLGWIVASALFSLYTANFGRYNETYGTLGVIIVVLSWLQISAFVVIAGAEMNATMRRRGR